MISSSYSVFYVWITEAFTKNNLTWKAQCEEGEDIIVLLVLLLNSVPL